MRSLIGIAVALMILWVILRFAAALTAGALHLLWIAAIIMFVIWLVGLIRGGGRNKPVV